MLEPVQYALVLFTKHRLMVYASEQCNMETFRKWLNLLARQERSRGKIMTAANCRRTIDRGFPLCYVL
jgi:hypothetical protein